MPLTGAPTVTDIRLYKDRRRLEVRFGNGEHFTLPAEFLRVESPSAEVKGHGPTQKLTVAGKRNVTIKGVEPVGNYAVRLVFDDNHDTGLYSWDYLLELGRNQDELWQAYSRALEEKGLSRDP